MSARAVVDSMIRIPRDSVSDAVVARLAESLAYRNPKCAPTRRAARFCREPEMLTTLREENGEILIPRGAASAVRSLGIALADRRLHLPPRAFTLRRELRAYQASARDEAVRREQGVIVVPTGGGKTLVGLAIVAAAQQPALILIPSLDLAEQWADAVRRDLGIEPSMCVGGAVEVGDVTIAHPRTLAGAGRLRGIRERFGLVLVDEAHHAPASTTSAILDMLPARYRFGLTATPIRGDELAPLVEHYLGPVIFRESASDLADRGFLVRPRREEVPTRFAFAYGGADDWPSLLDALVVDGGRNALIADLIARECRAGVVGLALTGRVAHVEELVALLRSRGLRAEGIVGTMPKARRAEVLNEARGGSLDVLVATQLADEGLDVPRLSRLFLAFPSKSEGLLMQRVGRVLRPHEGKSAPVIFDLVDPRVGVLANQARRRASAFRRAWGAYSLPEAA